MSTYFRTFFRSVKKDYDNFMFCYEFKYFIAINLHQYYNGNVICTRQDYTENIVIFNKNLNYIIHNVYHIYLFVVIILFLLKFGSSWIRKIINRKH